MKKQIVERVNQTRIKDNVKLTSVQCECGCIQWYGSSKRQIDGKRVYSYVCIQCGHKDMEV